MSKSRLSTQLVAYNQSYKENDEIYHNYAKVFGMTDTTFWLLYSLWESKTPYTQKELCKEWSYISQTLNSALKNLEKQGFIYMACTKENRKNKEIRFTDKGKEFAKNVIEPLMQAEAQSLSCMSREEMEQFLSCMRRLNVSLKKEVNRLILNRSEKEVYDEEK